MKNIIKKNQLMSYFILAFAWSWGCWAWLIFSTPADALLAGELPPTFFIFALLGGIGPTLSGFVIALITNGKKGAQETVSGLKKIKLPIGWYALSLLTVPALVAIQALLHFLTGRAITYNVTGVMLVMGFIWPLFSSFGEEIGWRGFAQPKMQKRLGVLSTSLILGLIWGLWHLPADYIAYSAYGWLFIPIFILLGPITLTAHSVIMTFLYNKTNGSLVLMILYHFTITMTGILSPSFAYSSQTDDLLKTTISVSVICIAALLVVIFSKMMRKNALLGMVNNA